MVERRGQIGRVARVLSERRAELPAVNVLRALRWRSRALALVGIVGDVLSQRRRNLMGYSAESRPLGAGAVGRMRGIRWVGLHRGHGSRERAGV